VLFVKAFLPVVLAIQRVCHLNSSTQPGNVTAPASAGATIHVNALDVGRYLAVEGSPRLASHCCHEVEPTGLRVQS